MWQIIFKRWLEFFKSIKRLKGTQFIKDFKNTNWKIDAIEMLITLDFDVEKHLSDLHYNTIL